MAIRKHFRKLLLLPVLASPLVALAEPIYAFRFLPAQFQAASINNTGQIVGAFGDAAAIWSPAGIIGIGAIAGGFQGDALAYSPLYENGGMVDLNTLIDPASGWHIVSAKDINDAQQILATACRMGECTSVPLDVISAVPEPKMWGMLLAGLVLIGSRRRRALRSETFS